MKEVKPKIYTRKGDDGSTSLVGGQRVSKGELRLECYGTIDELNAVLGCAVSGMALVPKTIEPVSLLALSRQLSQIQNELFNMGSRLACTDPKMLEKLPPIEESQVTRLETWIDEMSTVLPPLQNFILPGGSRAACELHLARTVARRAERAMVRLDALEPLSGELVRYINRLSDYLFVASRWCNHGLQIPETIWKK
jgi:cob(I)alamin adenosyltransferase